MNRMGFWEAVATLVGTIIGAGILGLPYVIAKVGILPGFFMLLILGLAALLMNLMFAEIVLRTRTQHQVAGYTKKYLGILPFRLEMLSMMFGGFGALTTYLIGEGQVLAALFGGHPMVYSLIFYGAAIIILFIGLRVIKVFELWMSLIFLALILVIAGISGTAIDWSNWQNFNLGNSFLPYGVILFAYSGIAAVVPLRQILRGKEKSVKKAVIIASAIPIVVYILFSFVVVGVTGSGTSMIATIGLGKFVGPSMIIFGNLFAFFAMGTSFLTMGLTLKDFFHFDLRFPRLLAWFTVAIVPLLAFLAGSQDFIATMEIVGSVTFGITGILIVSAFWRAKKKGDRTPEFSLPKYKILGSLLMLMSALGIVYAVYDVWVK